MLTALAFLLVAPPAPSAADLDRFPTLSACHVQLGALIRVRHQLRQAPASVEREQALRYNARQFAAWEALLEAHGDLAEEEDGRDDEATRRKALGRLRGMLTKEQWANGSVP
jgi:hypothetical protein